MVTPPPFDIYFGDGTEGPYGYFFELAGNFSVVTVQVKLLANEAPTQYTEGVEFSHDRDNKQITFLPGFFPQGDGVNENVSDVIRIERFTTRDRQIDYASGATMEEKNLDGDPNRLTFVDQEIEAGITDALRKNFARTKWECEGIPSDNAADAVTQSGWVTKSQLDAAVAGLGETDVNDAIVFFFTGDGAKTEYELINVVGATTALVNVYLESIYQTSDASVYVVENVGDPGHPGGGDGVSDFLTFATAPEQGAAIEIKVLIGTVLSELPDFSVTTIKIADNAVTLAKINLGSGPADRFMVVDASGDPVARRIGGADFSALLADENGTLAADFKTLLRTLRLDEFANPTNPLSMDSGAGNVQIKDLGIGTDPDDAIHLAQMEAHVAEEINSLAALSLRTEIGFLDRFLWNQRINNFNNAGVDWVITLAGGFKPDIVLISFYEMWTGTPSGQFWFLPQTPADDGNFIKVTSVGIGTPPNDQRYTLGMKVDSGANTFTLRGDRFGNIGEYNPPDNQNGGKISYFALKL